MTGTPGSHIFSRLVFFSRLFILAGMAIVFLSLLTFLSYYLCKLLFGVEIFGISYDSVKPDQTNLINALKVFQILAGSIGMFLIPAILFPLSFGSTFRKFIHYRAVKPGWLWPVSVLVLLLVSPFISWVYQANMKITFPAGWGGLEQSLRSMEEQAAIMSRMFVTAPDFGTLLFNLIVVALFPAICEELFFRGAMQGYVRKGVPSDWVAVVFTAIVFSAIHGQFFGFFPRFLLGVLLGFIYIRTGNILLSILLHFINNAIVVILSYYEKKLEVFAFLEDNFVFPWYVVLLSALVFAGYIYFLLRLPEEKDESMVEDINLENT